MHYNSSLLSFLAEKESGEAGRIKLQKKGSDRRRDVAEEKRLACICKRPDDDELVQEKVGEYRETQGNGRIRWFHDVGEALEWGFIDFLSTDRARERETGEETT